MTTRVAAVHNNALWCDAVCRAFGCTTSRVAGLWVNHDPAPPYYSNAVTIDPAALDDQRSMVLSMLAGPLPRPWTIKDAFHTLDLMPIGFHILFAAEWIGLTGATAAASPDTEARWAAVSTDTGLVEWEAAWRGDNADADAAGSPRLFRPRLLDDPDIRFLAGRRDGDIAAVAIANRSDDGSGPVVGISNIVLSGSVPERDRRGAVIAVQAAYPGLPVVGYERGADLAAMRALGFRSLGPLRVWITDD